MSVEHFVRSIGEWSNDNYSIQTRDPTDRSEDKRSRSDRVQAHTRHRVRKDRRKAHECARTFGFLLGKVVESVV